jgi:hypothetical protein
MITLFAAKGYRMSDITLLKQRMSEEEWHLRDSVKHATGEPQVLLTMTVFGFQPSKRSIWQKIRRRIPIGFRR